MPTRYKCEECRHCQIESISMNLKSFLCTKLRSLAALIFLLLLGYVIIVYLATVASTPIKKAKLVIVATLFDVIDGYSDAQRQTWTSWNVTSRTPLPSVCIDETCRRQYEEQLHRPDVFPIPKIRHLLWRNESVSLYFAQQLRTWQKVHPDWTYVLWRDKDLEPFVARNYPALLEKFKSLNSQIMRVDMIRYMLLLKFGGTYADLDYSVTQSLDQFRRFHALVTREPEAHSLALLGLVWPIRPLANPAFLMSAPGHTFYHFVLERLAVTDTQGDVLGFAGPFGLTRMIEEYESLRPLTRSSMTTVYIPPSFSFYPYQNNSLYSCSPDFFHFRKGSLEASCRRIFKSKDPAIRRLRRVKNVAQLCTNVTNLDPITDASQPVFAVHDVRKNGPSWDSNGAKRLEYITNLTDVRQALRNVKMGSDFDNLTNASAMFS